MSNGTLLPHTPISVDFWRVRQCPAAQVFFLTHLHGDHIAGLTPTWSRPIYCTSITKKLLVHKLQIREELIHALATNESHTVWLDEAHREMMTVTVIDAHHCPGSAMFLFQGYFGTILHTGDFRYSDKMFIDTPLSQSHTVDVLYLDNTYSSPACEFPTRRHAMEQVFEILDKYPDHEVLVGMRSLGKEDLLVAMALHVRTWIVVTSEQYKQLSILDMPNVFTTDPEAGHIHVIPMRQANKYTLEKWNSQRPTIAIIPTALYNSSANPYVGVENLFVVPYSDHSSYSELHRFVEKVHPKKIIPVVDAKARGPLGEDLSGRADMSCYKKYLDQRDIPHFEVPKSVEAFMRKSQPEISRKGSEKRKRKAIHGMLANKRRGSVTRGVEYDEDEVDENDASSKNQAVVSVTTQDAKVCDQPKKSPKVRTKKKSTKWQLVPISIPVEQQESVWKSIGDPHWYFENKVKALDTEESCVSATNTDQKGSSKGPPFSDNQPDVTCSMNQELNNARVPSHPSNCPSSGEIDRGPNCLNKAAVSTDQDDRPFSAAKNQPNDMLDESLKGDCVSPKMPEPSVNCLSSKLPEPSGDCVSPKLPESSSECVSSKLPESSHTNIPTAPSENQSLNVDPPMQGLDTLEELIQLEEGLISTDTVLEVPDLENTCSKVVTVESMLNPAESQTNVAEVALTSDVSNSDRKSQTQPCSIDFPVAGIQSELSSSTLAGPSLSGVPQENCGVTVSSCQVDQTVEIQMQNDPTLCFVNNETVLGFQEPSSSTPATEQLFPVGSVEQDVLEFLQRNPSIFSSTDISVADTQTVAYQTDIVTDDLPISLPEALGNSHQAEIPYLFNLDNVAIPETTTGQQSSQTNQDGSKSFEVIRSTAEPTSVISNTDGDNQAPENVEQSLDTIYTIDISELNSLLLNQQLPCEGQSNNVDTTTGGEEQTITLTLDGSPAEGDTTNTIPGSFIVDPQIVAQGPEAVSQELNRLANELLERINEVLQNPNEKSSEVNLDSFIPSEDPINDPTHIESVAPGSEEAEKLVGDSHQSKRQRRHMIKTDDGDKKYFLWGPTSGCSSWQMRGKKRTYDPRRILLSENVDLPGGLALAGTASCMSKAHESDNKFNLRGKRKRKGWPKGKPRGPRKDNSVKVDPKVGSDKQIKLVIKLGKKPVALLKDNASVSLKKRRKHNNSDKDVENNSGAPVSQPRDAPTSEFKSIFELLAEVCPSWSGTSDPTPSTRSTSPFTSSDGFHFHLTANNNVSQMSSSLEGTPALDLDMPSEMVSDDDKAQKTVNVTESTASHHQVVSVESHETQPTATKQHSLEMSLGSFGSESYNEIPQDMGDCAVGQSGNIGMPDNRVHDEQSAVCADTLKDFCSGPLTDLGGSILEAEGSSMCENTDDSESVQQACNPDLYGPNNPQTAKSQTHDKVKGDEVVQVSHTLEPSTSESCKSQFPSSSSSTPSDNHQLEAPHVSMDGDPFISSSSVFPISEEAEDAIGKAGSKEKYQSAESVISDESSSDEDGWLTCDEEPDISIQPDQLSITVISTQIPGIPKSVTIEKEDSSPIDTSSPSSPSLPNSPCPAVPKTPSKRSEEELSKLPFKMFDADCTLSNSSPELTDISHDSRCADEDALEKYTKKSDDVETGREEVSTEGVRDSYDKEQRTSVLANLSVSQAKEQNSSSTNETLPDKSTNVTDKDDNANLSKYSNEPEHQEGLSDGLNDSDPSLGQKEIQSSSYSSDGTCDVNEGNKNHHRYEEKPKGHAIALNTHSDKVGERSKEPIQTEELQSEESLDEEKGDESSPAFISCSENEMEGDESDDHNQKSCAKESVSCAEEEKESTASHKDNPCDSFPAVEQGQNKSESTGQQNNAFCIESERNCCSPENRIMPCDSCHGDELDRSENEVEKYEEDIQSDESRRHQAPCNVVRCMEQDRTAQPDSTSSPQVTNEDLDSLQYDRRLSSENTVGVGQNPTASDTPNHSEQQCLTTSTVSEPSKKKQSRDEVSMCEYSRHPQRVCNQSISNASQNRQIPHPCLINGNPRRVLGLSISRVITTSVGTPDCDENKSNDSDVIFICEGIECVSKEKNICQSGTTDNAQTESGQNDREPDNPIQTDEDTQGNFITIEPDSNQEENIQNIVSVDPNISNSHQESENVIRVEPENPLQMDETSQNIITVEPNNNYLDQSQGIQDKQFSAQPENYSDQEQSKKNDITISEEHDVVSEELQIFEIVPESPETIPDSPVTDTEDPQTNVEFNSPKSGTEEDCQTRVIGSILAKQSSSPFSSHSDDSRKSKGLKQSSIISYLSSGQEKHQEAQTLQPIEKNAVRQTARKRVTASCMKSSRRKSDQELLQLAIKRETERRLLQYKKRHASATKSSRKTVVSHFSCEEQNRDGMTSTPASNKHHVVHDEIQDDSVSDQSNISHQKYPGIRSENVQVQSEPESQHNRTGWLTATKPPRSAEDNHTDPPDNLVQPSSGDQSFTEKSNVKNCHPSSTKERKILKTLLMTPMEVNPRALRPIEVTPKTKRPVEVTPRTLMPMQVNPRTLRPMQVSSGTLRLMQVSAQPLRPTEISERTPRPMEATPRTPRPIEVNPRTVMPMKVTPRTLGSMQVTQKTSGPMDVTPRTIGSLEVTQRTRPTEVTPKTMRPVEVSTSTPRPVEETPRTLGHMEVSTSTEMSMDDTPRTPKPIEVTPRTLNPMEVTPRILNPMEVSASTPKYVEVTPRTLGHMEVTPRTMKPVDVNPRITKPMEVSTSTPRPIDVTSRTQTLIEVTPRTLGHVEFSRRTPRPMEVTPRTMQPMEISTKTKPMNVGTFTPRPVEVTPRTLGHMEVTPRTTRPMEVTPRMRPLEVSSSMPRPVEVIPRTLGHMEVGTRTTMPMEITPRTLRPLATPQNKPLKKPATSTKRVMKTKATFLVKEKRPPKDKINVVLTDGESLDVLGATPRHVTQFVPFDDNVLRFGRRQDRTPSKQAGVQPSSTS